MRIYEYMNNANDNGNEVVPNFIDHSDCGHFFNPADFSYVGARLSERVYVPSEVTELTRASLKTRCKIAGVMMKLVDEELVQMTNEEIDAIVDIFCNDRNIA